MKIGIDCRLWDETGVGRYIRNLVLNLQKIDKKNQYVLFVLSKDYSNISSQLSTFNFQLVRADVRWHSVEEQLKFPMVLKRENLDIMHFPYFSVPIFYNRPYVVTIHDLIQNHYASGKASTLPFFFYYIKKIGYKRVLKNAVSKAKKIIVPLVCVQEDLMNTLKVPKGKIVVTPEGFDTNIKKGQVSENVLNASKNPYFLYVGNAYPHKNLENLIKAFEMLINTNDERINTNIRNKFDTIRSNSHVNLMLVGREDYFYKRLKKRNKSDKLIFLHDVSDSDLFYLYSHALAATSASLMEGFGLFPLEALGTGTIPVVSNIPSFREVCADLAIYFNPKDPQDIAEKLMKVLKLKVSEREGIKKNAESLLKKFSWSKMAQQTLSIYEAAALNP